MQSVARNILRRLRISLFAAAALAAACSTGGQRAAAPETGYATRRIEKAGRTAAVSPGFVRIEGEGFFALEREDDEAWFVRVGDDAPVPPPATGADTPPAPFRAAGRARFSLHLLELGLPRDAQWRGAFALSDLDGDGVRDLVAAPPRKWLTPPQWWSYDGTRFARRTAQWPPRHYDYGAAAAGDFDDDGRADVALGMHLVGLAALFGTDGGRFVERSSGLPGTPDALPGSAVALLANVAPGPDTLIALAEPAARRGTQTTGFRGLVEFAFDGERWQPRTTLDAEARGSALAHAVADTCPEKLLAAGTGAQGALLWEKHGEHWRARPMHAGEPPRRRHATAVALGDFDGDGCSDLAYARSELIAEAWHHVLELRLDRGRAGWEIVPLERGAGRSATTALGALRYGPETVLLTADRTGALQVYAPAADGFERAGAAAPAPWHAGCAGRHVAAVDLDGDSRDEALVGFAGEPGFARRECLGGGGVTAWRLGDR